LFFFNRQRLTKATLGIIVPYITKLKNGFGRTPEGAVKNGQYSQALKIPPQSLGQLYKTCFVA
jgi:hypothetical protein